MGYQSRLPSHRTGWSPAGSECFSSAFCPPQAHPYAALSPPRSIDSIQWGATLLSQLISRLDSLQRAQIAGTVQQVDLVVFGWIIQALEPILPTVE
ncbi:MAG: hypothetical protein HY731_06870 [Candidatus Tectomicrobia bacterium]|nr:hypothetical protein [Candidatus Tectomicrobia bacterium]